MNHFSKVCHSKFKPPVGKEHAKTVTAENHSSEISRVEKSDSDNSEEYTFTTAAQVNQLSKPIFEVKIGNTPIRIMADSGATVNILSEQDFNSIVRKPQISETKTKVYPYMSEKPLNLCGKFEAEVSSKLGSSEETFYVAKGSSNSILSWSTSQKLNLIKAVSVINQLDPSYHPMHPSLLRIFATLPMGWVITKGNQYVYM
jgi:hypothetical protein